MSEAVDRSVGERLVLGVVDGFNAGLNLLEDLLEPGRSAGRTAGAAFENRAIQQFDDTYEAIIPFGEDFPNVDLHNDEAVVSRTDKDAGKIDSKNSKLESLLPECRIQCSSRLFINEGAEEVPSSGIVNPDFRAESAPHTESDVSQFRDQNTPGSDRVNSGPQDKAVRKSGDPKVQELAGKLDELLEFVDRVVDVMSEGDNERISQMLAPFANDVRKMDRLFTLLMNSISSRFGPNSDFSISFGHNNQRGGFVFQKFGHPRLEIPVGK